MLSLPGYMAWFIFLQGVNLQLSPSSKALELLLCANLTVFFSSYFPFRNSVAVSVGNVAEKNKLVCSIRNVAAAFRESV